MRLFMYGIKKKKIFRYYMEREIKIMSDSDRDKMIRYVLDYPLSKKPNRSVTEEERRQLDFIGMRTFIKTTPEGKNFMEELNTTFLNGNESEIREHLTRWHNRGDLTLEPTTTERLVNRWFDFYLTKLKPRYLKIIEDARKEGEIQRANAKIQRAKENKCRYCNRQKNGRFDTCCQACINGSHTEECDRRNRVLPTYAYAPIKTRGAYPHSTGLSLERWKEEKGGKKKRRTNKKRTKKNKSRKFRK